MSAPRHGEGTARSHRRDSHVRTVTRVTRTVAAAAVLGTAAFGGLAAAGTHASTPSPIGSSASADRSRDLAPPASPPSASAQAPAASSGGS